MDIATAQTAGQIAAQIQPLTQFITQLQQMIAEGWTITSMAATAPDTGSTSPSGTTVNLLPFGPANQPNSALALQTALSTYQAQLAALQTQLAGL